MAEEEVKETTESQVKDPYRDVRPSIYTFKYWLHDLMCWNCPVIGLAGHAGAGKDSSVRFIEKVEYPVTITSFAKPIREIAKILGFTDKQLSDRDLKETVDPRFNISPRRLMQLIGTEMFREMVDQDIWAKICISRIQENLVTDSPRRMTFITDVRFPNEVKAIHDVGGIVIRIDRVGHTSTAENASVHPSEIYIDQLDVDGVMINDANSADEWSDVAVEYKFPAILQQIIKRKYSSAD